MSNDKDIITKTNDGYVVELFGKINAESEDLVEGISILEPSKSLVEEEQYNEYSEIVQKMDYKPVIIKTSEIENETMVLKTQLRAVLRVAKEGDVSIVFPKISTIVELRQYKEILEECKNELESENIPYKKHIKVGIIVEIPSAALMAYELARECDFFFIDTDSLTKHTFGYKKKKQKDSESYMKFQLGIIKLVQQAKQGAHDAGIFCGISGEMVENELYIPLLIGLGLDQFSINSKKVSNVRKKINELDKSDCKEFAKEVLQLRTIEDIERKLKQFKQN